MKAHRPGRVWAFKGKVGFLWMLEDPLPLCAPPSYPCLCPYSLSYPGSQLVQILCCVFLYTCFFLSHPTEGWNLHSGFIHAYKQGKLGVQMRGYSGCLLQGSTSFCFSALSRNVSETAFNVGVSRLQPRVNQVPPGASTAICHYLCPFFHDKVEKPPP